VLLLRRHRRRHGSLSLSRSPRAGVRALRLRRCEERHGCGCGFRWGGP
jgi:hypothetical protein